MKTKFVTYIIFTVVLLGYSCKTTKTIVFQEQKLENLKPEKIYEQVIRNELDYTNLNIKFNSDLAIGEQTNNFGGIIRIKKDSIIWISITKLNLEGMRICFTNDSIKFINRMENTYLAEDFKTFAIKTGIDLDFKSIQSILTNSLFLYPCVEDEKAAVGNFKQCRDSNYYCISSISERKYSKYYSNSDINHRWEKKLEKTIKDSIENTKNNDFVFQIVKIIPQKYKIQSMYLENYIRRQTLNISYNDFFTTNEQYFPLQINMHLITPAINLLFNINIKDVTISNKSDNFPFKISNKYKRITLQ